MSRIFNFQNWHNPYSTVFLEFLDRQGNVRTRAVNGRADDHEIETVDLSYLFRTKKPQISYPYGRGVHFCNYDLKFSNNEMRVFALAQKEVTYQGKTYLMYDYPNAVFVTAMNNGRMGLVCVTSILVWRSGQVDLFRLGNLDHPNVPLVMRSETDDTITGKKPYNFSLVFNGESFSKMPSNLINYFLGPEDSLIVERKNVDTVGGNSYKPVVAFYPSFGKGDGDWMEFHVVTGDEVFKIDEDIQSEGTCYDVTIASAYSDETVISEETITAPTSYGVLIG